MSKADSDSALHVVVSTSGQQDAHEFDVEMPIELGEVVTARLGGKAAVARIIRGWTRKVTPAGARCLYMPELFLLGAVWGSCPWFSAAGRGTSETALLHGGDCCNTLVDACMLQVAEDRRLEHLTAGYRANPQLHLQRQVQN